MIKKLESIEFRGDIHENEDISAIAAFGNFLIIGSDETKKKIQVLQQVEDNSYEVTNDIELLIPEESESEEFDIEGMEITQDHTLFVIGSHSLKRKKIDPDKTYEKNRERIATVKPEDKKNRIFKLTLDSETGIPNGIAESINIKETILQDKVLKIFTQIPSKENGIDIEGIAVDGEQLYLGFRGPVLRLNYVPVVVTTFDKPSDYAILYVNLGGSGIRDITKVKDGFLIISGPVGDGFAPYQLYFWDGLDTIPGNNKPREAQMTLLGEIPSPQGAKAEGITVIEETTSAYKVIIVYDGLPNGAATMFQITKLA